MDPSHYFSRVYPLQDSVLSRLTALDTGLYLTGGTAASRGYLHHRFSDDLDLFANDAGDFVLWADRVVHALASDATTGAQGTAAGVFAADVARALYGATTDDWAAIRWTDPPPPALFVADLRALAEDLLLNP